MRCRRPRLRKYPYGFTVGSRPSSMIHECTGRLVSHIVALGIQGRFCPPSTLSRNGYRMSHHTHQKKSHETPKSTVAANPGTSPAGDNRNQPSADHIRLRAYEISQARKGESGDALADWIQAEQEATTGRDTRH